MFHRLLPARFAVHGNVFGRALVPLWTSWPCQRSSLGVLRANYCTSREELQAKAEDGDVSAQMQLAKYHWAQLQQRECDVEYHTGRAREYLQMAADFEDLEAMYMLGVLTLTSTVDQHHLPMVGIQYLKKAADMGHARAQQELGLLLVSEEKDEWSRLAHARELFTNAAEQGMLLSKARLGKMMMLGEGGAVNKERGMELLQEVLDELEAGAEVQTEADRKLQAQAKEIALTMKEF